jgi:hypothetical protein
VRGPGGEAGASRSGGTILIPAVARKRTRTSFTSASALDATADWAGDPCTRCGKHPLSILNKSRLCRNCSRNHHHPDKLDMTKNCKGCGKSGLTLKNKTGYCRLCNQERFPLRVALKIKRVVDSQRNSP